ncbi:DUF1772 domain-containing protein [Aspergillus affinis]|uniref:DUF1772 domain-containing protein n=1 Tax=Aspergillus affinis TaxID=1070780 RepID=UPI0022FE4520|nr:uncharacterized protein KD926_004738 [Aspergillus affinis]KAI9042947.1 hypothetical protein KD926_004738 [Aspergillus affinis]
MADSRNTVGNIAALSLIAMPALGEVRSENAVPQGVILKLWHKMYEAGKAQNPPIAAAAASAFFYLAWSGREGGHLFRHARFNLAGLYSTAAILTLGIVPYTIVTMRSTNNTLIGLAQSSKPLTNTEETKSRNLLGRWVVLNGIRSLLPLAGALFGITAIFA